VSKSAVLLGKPKPTEYVSRWALSQSIRAECSAAGDLPAWLPPCLIGTVSMA